MEERTRRIRRILFVETRLSEGLRLRSGRVLSSIEGRSGRLSSVVHRNRSK